jgi:SAM-dependent MidA family methyltransferase
VFAAGVARLLEEVDVGLGRPEALDFVDMGAGGGELGSAVVAALPREVAARVRVHAVDVAPRPEGLDDRVTWSAEPPRGARGLLFANEWLDNVPLDVAAPDPHGTPRYVEVDPETGEERLGEPLEPDDSAWLARWWPHPDDGEPGGANGVPGAVPESPGDLLVPPADGPFAWRAEIGRSRDEAWARAVDGMAAGLAVAADYGHTRPGRPRWGTLTGYRKGRQVAPIPDGSRDVTAHVAMDAVADIRGGTLTTQREALRALGVSGTRPPLALAGQDPAGYVRALAAAGEAAELTARGGLGDFLWLTTAIDPQPAVPAPPPATE